jgi:hypothetical protein
MVGGNSFLVKACNFRLLCLYKVRLSGALSIADCVNVSCMCMATWYTWGMEMFEAPSDDGARAGGYGVGSDVEK